MRNIILNNFEKQYRLLLNEIFRHNVKRDDRTGVGCYSTFNKTLTWNLNDGFPMITGRKMFPKSFDTEFNWFMNGETNIQRFRDAGVKIWDAWADERGDLGPVYGHQLRNWNNTNIDQLKTVIRNIKTFPDSRRHIISLWNVEQLPEMKLPPCYLYFQFFVDGDKLNMFALQRSGDVFLGIPYDVALFSQILLYISHMTGLKANRIDMNIIDAHIYTNQLAPVMDYLKTPMYDTPDFKYLTPGKYGVDVDLRFGKVELINYKHGPVITAPVAV